MTNEELIARQAKELAELRDEVELLKSAGNEVLLHIYCIGGPLNDNKLGYSKEQRSVFLEIVKVLRGAGIDG